MRLPSAVTEQRVIAIARGIEPREAVALAEAVLAGGLTVIEFTMESGAAPAAIASLADSQLTVGAGTVRTVAEAELATEAGAEFLVSPHLDETLAEWTASNDRPYLPGILTPTEAARAIALGIEHVKLFPASLGGPSLVRALLAPFPDLRIVPTGGVDGNNARSFLDAGGVAVGVGSWLTGPDDLSLVTERAASLREAVAG